MKIFSIRNHPMIRLSGRFDPAQEGFPMLWSAASLEVQISCTYYEYKPYLEMDELRVPARKAAILPASWPGSPWLGHWFAC